MECERRSGYCLKRNEWQDKLYLNQTRFHSSDTLGEPKDYEFFDLVSMLCWESPHKLSDGLRPSLSKYTNLASEQSRRTDGDRPLFKCIEFDRLDCWLSWFNSISLQAQADSVVKTVKCLESSDSIPADPCYGLYYFQWIPLDHKMVAVSTTVKTRQYTPTLDPLLTLTMSNPSPNCSIPTVGGLPPNQSLL